jgi:hypothetical protein
VVPDTDKLAEAAQSAAREASATVSFCAIGVGKGSQKMPAAEVQYPEAFAIGCMAGGALLEPEVKAYEYSDMKLLFNKDDPKD